MNLAYALLPLGLAALGVPTPVFSPETVRSRLRRPERRKGEGLGTLLRSPLNWIDLARGCCGVLLLQRVFDTPTGDQDDLAVVHLVAQMVILSMAVLAQTIWLTRPVRMIGPLFFLCGLTLGVSGPEVGGFALVLGLSCAMICKRLSLSFAIVPLGLVAFGLLFHSFTVLGLLNALLFGLPFFFRFAAGQRLAFVRRTPVQPGVRSRPAVPAPAEEEPALNAATVIRPDFGSGQVKIKPAADSRARADYDGVDRMRAAWR